MRAFAVIGPSQSGKSTLIQGLARLEEGRCEPLRLHGDTALTPFDFMDESWAAIEVPGGRDTLAQVGPVLATCDAAVLCVPAQAEAAVLSAPYLRLLEDASLPTFLFINKVDAASDRIADIVTSLQQYCRHGIVLRQIPIRADGEITGIVDLISERAWQYREGERSSLVDLPVAVSHREQEARSDLLEALADFDDGLLEQIIEDRQPITEEVYSIATQVLQHHDLVPAFLGAAGHGNGLLRLLKSLRHETPTVEALRQRLELTGKSRAAACAGNHLKHLGKIVLVRALDDSLASGVQLSGQAIGTFNSLDAKTPLQTPLRKGEFALTIKSDHISMPAFLTPDGAVGMPDWAAPPPPALKRLVLPSHGKDDGKLAAALSRLAEIDPGLDVRQDDQSGSPLIGIHGEQHLRHTLGKLRDAFGVDATCAEVATGLRETIRRKTTVHYRHRKQSGGAGQFADVVIDVAPGPTGSGSSFDDTVKGGAVPRNYIPSVEAGVRDALLEGPNGYPVVDVSVTLRDGKSHSVDSSDHAFRTAGQNAVRDALEEVGTTLLQPILSVEIQLPSVFTGSLVQLVSSLKGQVLGFDSHPDAEGWDIFRALLPMSAEENLSRSLASNTRGTAWFSSETDHYEELRDAVSGNPT